MIIAIDGPAGSGKSTIAKIVAEKLRFRYIDTGSMYRSVAWKSLKKKTALADEDAVANLAWKTKIELTSGENGQLVFVDGENITSQLMNESISRGAAIEALPHRRALSLLRKPMNRSVQISRIRPYYDSDLPCSSVTSCNSTRESTP